MTTNVIAFPEQETFKIQRPLRGQLNKVFVYNQSRTQYGEVDPTHDILELLGAEPNVYVNGYLDADSHLCITGVARERCRW